MKRFHNVRVWLRLLLAVGLIGVVTTGVTYAALQSQQASLKGNTVESATAVLQVSKDGGTFISSVAGFDFNGLIPGGPAMPSQTNGYPLWLHNSGSAPLNVNISVAATPTTSGDIDLTKVSVILTPVNNNGTAGTPQSFTLASLVASKATGGTPVTTPTLTANTTVQYKIQVQMAADAFTGDSASISNLDIVFGGTAATS